MEANTKVEIEIEVEVEKEKGMGHGGKSKEHGAKSGGRRGERETVEEEVRSMK